MADINIYGTIKTMAEDGRAAYVHQVYDIPKEQMLQDTLNDLDAEIDTKQDELDWLTLYDIDQIIAKAIEDDNNLNP